MRQPGNRRQRRGCETLDAEAADRIRPPDASRLDRGWAWRPGAIGSRCSGRWCFFMSGQRAVAAKKPERAKAPGKRGQASVDGTKAVPAVEPEKIDPGPRNKSAIEQATQAYQARPVRVSIGWEKTGDGKGFVTSPHADDVGHVLQLTSTFGTTSSDFMARNLGYLEHSTRDRKCDRGDSMSEVNSGLALVAAIDPQDELEAALAVQMAGCHALAMEMLGRAKTTDRTDHVESYGNMAVKLQRTFTAQIEALGRMRGKGQQTVRVEHVTVQPGAQAIVGDVHHHTPGGAGGQSKSEGQPHEKSETAFTAQERPALPRPHPQGNGVPITGDAKRPVPAPRRTVTRRPRKSERP